MANRDLIWFGSEWIGQIVNFKKPLCSWMIVEKLLENIECYMKQDFEISKFYSESSSIFVCEDTNTSIRAIMKVRMQIPYYEAREFHSHERAQQAVGNMCARAKSEAEALETLTIRKCPSTPTLIAWKHEIQDEDGCVPGGFVDYIVMERHKGITLSLEKVHHLTAERKQCLRIAFKEAYENCLQRGVVHLDKAARILIWDEENARCYLIDWEIWRRQREGEEWNDGQYRFWGLD